VIQAGVLTQTLLDKTVQYLGDKPIVQWLGFGANPDSNLWRYPNLSFFYATQSDRAVAYAAAVNFLYNATVTSSSMKPVIGFKWWSLVDSWGEKSNWGLVSLRDNAYDGREARVSSGTDAWG